MVNQILATQETFLLSETTSEGTLANSDDEEEDIKNGDNDHLPSNGTQKRNAK